MAFNIRLLSTEVFDTLPDMSQSIEGILDYFRDEAANNRDLDDKFEKLIAAYLTKDPLYSL